MKTMAPRQRLFNVLDGKPTDKVPVWLLFPYHRTGYYVDVRNHDGYRRVLDYSLERGVIMLNRRSLGVRLHQGDVAYPLSRKLLASDEDLEAFCGMPLQDDEKVLGQELERQLDPYMREKKEFPLESGAMMLDLGSPINTIYHAADLCLYPVWSMTHPSIIEHWLDRRMRQLEFVYRFCLDRDLADIYFLVGSELASPPMVSPETFDRWVVPYERQLISLIHSYGKKVIQHYHGQIREVLPAFGDMAPDGLHTIEAPPVGNCTLSQAFEITQEKITLIGNIQYDVFRSASPAQMKQHVRDVLDEVGERRFILSPSAGPFDESPPEALFDNYRAFIDAASEYSTRG